MQFVLSKHHLEVILHYETNLLAEESQSKSVGDAEEGSDVVK